MYQIATRVTGFLLIVTPLVGSWTSSLAQVSDPALRGGEVPLERIGAIENVAFEGTHRLSPVMPNPAGALATTTLEVADAQDVQAELFDVSGRRVATPLAGAVTARSATEIELGVGVLAPGVYVLRISGETFIETRRFTVVR